MKCGESRNFPLPLLDSSFIMSSIANIVITPRRRPHGVSHSLGSAGTPGRRTVACPRRGASRRILSALPVEASLRPPSRSTRCPLRFCSSLVSPLLPSFPRPLFSRNPLIRLPSPPFRLPLLSSLPFLVSFCDPAAKRSVDTVSRMSGSSAEFGEAINIGKILRSEAA
jgi:hypothetical protein